MVTPRLREPKREYKWTAPIGYEFDKYRLKKEISCCLVEEDHSRLLDNEPKLSYTVFLTSKETDAWVSSSCNSIREAVIGAFDELREASIRDGLFTELFGLVPIGSCKPHTKESLMRMRNLIITGDPDYRKEDKELLWNTCSETRV